MPNIGPVELIIILVIALLVIGPGKLPDVGKALGSTIREFRKATTEIQESVSTTPQKPAQTAPAAQAAAPAQPAEAPPVAEATIAAKAPPSASVPGDGSTPTPQA